MVINGNVSYYELQAINNKMGTTHDSKIRQSNQVSRPATGGRVPESSSGEGRDYIMRTSLK